MQEIKTPIFKKGRILKIEMLERMRDYPKELLDIEMADYSDGILYGCDPVIREDELDIRPGLIKEQGKLYFFSEPITIAYGSSEQDTILKLQIHEMPATADYAVTEYNCILSDQFQLASHEFELARFKLKPGAYLRDDYEDMEDFSTIYNTVNLIYRQHASIGGPTISPGILQYFVKELMRYESQHPHDIALYYQVMNRTTAVSREVLLTYIKSRLEREMKLESNEEIYRQLVSIVTQVKKERRVGSRAMARGARLLID